MDPRFLAMDLSPLHFLEAGATEPYQARQFLPATTKPFSALLSPVGIFTFSIKTHLCHLHRRKLVPTLVTNMLHRLYHSLSYVHETKRTGDISTLYLQSPSAPQDISTSIIGEYISSFSSNCPVGDYELFSN